MSPDIGDQSAKSDFIFENNEDPSTHLNDAVSYSLDADGLNYRAAEFTHTVDNAYLKLYNIFPKISREPGDLTAYFTVSVSRSNANKGACEYTIPLHGHYVNGLYTGMSFGKIVKNYSRKIVCRENVDGNNIAFNIGEK